MKLIILFSLLLLLLSCGKEGGGSSSKKGTPSKPRVEAKACVNKLNQNSDLTLAQISELAWRIHDSCGLSKKATAELMKNKNWRINE